MQFGLISQQPGKAGLARTRRSPEDDRGQASGGDHAADRAFGADQMILAHDVGQLPGAQPVGQWRIGRIVRTLRPVPLVIKQAGHR